MRRILTLGLALGLATPASAQLLNQTPFVYRDLPAHEDKTRQALELLLQKCPLITKTFAGMSDFRADLQFTLHGSPVQQRTGWDHYLLVMIAYDPAAARSYETIFGGYNVDYAFIGIGATRGATGIYLQDHGAARLCGGRPDTFRADPAFAVFGHVVQQLAADQAARDADPRLNATLAPASSSARR